MGLIYLLLMLVAMGLVLPVVWIIRLWLDDRLISTTTALCGILVHIATIISLAVMAFMTGTLLVAYYSGTVLLTIVCMPLLRKIADQYLHRTMNSEDILRYQRAVARHPENAAAHAALGRAYAALRRYDEAIAAFQQAIALDPDHMEYEQRELRNAERERAARELAKDRSTALRQRLKQLIKQ